MMRVQGVSGDWLPWPMLDADDWRTEHFHDIRIRIQLGLLPTQHSVEQHLEEQRLEEQYSEEQYSEEQYLEEQYLEEQYSETNYNADTETDTETDTQIPFNQIGRLYSL